MTVRANIKQLVGGAGEDTVLARVGEGIVSSIGSSASHKTVLENPDFISRVVLEKGLDAGTAFEILSIDIADIDVGKNIGAVLQMDQANADKNIAQAKAEEKPGDGRSPMEQEMKAKAPGGACQGDSGRSRDSDGYCRSVPFGKPRDYGLLQIAEYPGRYPYARRDCQDG